jgi:hypothetical protein
VEEAIGQYSSIEHPSILSALAALGVHAFPIASRQMLSSENLSCEKFCKMLMAGETTELRDQLLVLLPIPSLTRAALHGLLRSSQQNGLHEALGPWHLLLNPRVGIALRKLPVNDHLWPQPDAIAAWKPQVTQGLAVRMAVLYLLGGGKPEATA